MRTIALVAMSSRPIRSLSQSRPRNRCHSLNLSNHLQHNRNSQRSRNLRHNRNLNHSLNHNRSCHLYQRRNQQSHFRKIFYLSFRRDALSQAAMLRLTQC